MPGTSGVITPFCETHGLYFSNKAEPEEGKYEIDKLAQDYLLQEDKTLVETCGVETFEDYQNIKQHSKNVISKISTSKVEKETDMLYVNISFIDGR